jgi:putative Mg2+ transporter-C (MgtC) family protein
MISFLTPLQTEHLIQLLASILVGMLIGLEREVTRKPAGMRTCTLVCLGSTLFTILSQVLSVEGADPTRIASNIITGIGFLGAGSIVIHKDKVLGLTTAAVVWFTSSLGMAIGFNQYALALFGVVLCLTILTIFRIIEGKVISYRQKHR